EEEEEEEQQQLSVLALLLTVFRKSLLGCKTDGAGDEDFGSLDIGWPTDVRHVAHVTFDRFHGFLGLPVEFEPEVPRRAPSARCCRTYPRDGDGRRVGTRVRFGFTL
ncbi:unnamed protein product, partial [Musa banksii]